MRDLEVKKAAKRALAASWRPRRPVITQVPVSDGGGGPNPRKTGTMRPVVVPYKPPGMDWEEARKCGRAYGRVLEGHPPYPTPEEMSQLGLIRTTSARPKRGERVRKDPRGDWWMAKFADAVERRAKITVPSHSRHYEAKKDEPAPDEAKPAE